MLVLKILQKKRIIAQMKPPLWQRWEQLCEGVLGVSGVSGVSGTLFIVVPQRSQRLSLLLLMCPGAEIFTVYVSPQEQVNVLIPLAVQVAAVVTFEV